LADATGTNVAVSVIVFAKIQNSWRKMVFLPKFVNKSFPKSNVCYSAGVVKLMSLPNTGFSFHTIANALK
jgi:phenolic acid decarboxylase